MNTEEHRKSQLPNIIPTFSLGYYSFQSFLSFFSGERVYNTQFSFVLIILKNRKKEKKKEFISIMGNSGSFNLGVIGFDYNENGGGVTLGGIRIGGGKNGAEFGVNAAIGAEIDGKGLATGAQAKVAIGEQGVNATAKAKATAAAAEAGAAATAGVDYDGSTHADSGDTSSANVRFAEDRYNDAKQDLAHSKSSKERAEQDLILKRKALEDQRKIVHDMEEEQKKMEHSKVTAGQKKTECLKRKDQLLEELQSLENDVFWKKRKERKIERKQSRDNQINSAEEEEEEEEDGVVDQIAMEIAKLKNDIHAVHESITKLTEDIQELEKNLLDIAERIAAARTELDKAEQGEKEAEAHVAEAEEKYRLCEKDFKEAESNLEKTKSDRDREKKAQDMYRNG